MSLDHASVAELFRRLDREIWLLTAAHGDRRGGLIATFVSQASIAAELPRVLVGIARTHHTWSLVDGSSAFALHLLGEQHLDWVWRFGLQSGRETDKFAGLPLESQATGSPILPGVLGWLDCRVEARLETGDRTLFLGEVVAGRQLTAVPPLTLQRLLQLASVEQLLSLKQQLEQDAGKDAEAIRSWRQRAW
jgi:flavin reductase (DIM6/NTAB) family NADH-FMN oxidoreductase RutF